jgi:hypothetical protein
MPVEKTTPIKTTTTITLVLPVCYFLVLFEVTPMTNIATDALPVYNTSGSTTDNTASIIQTITVTSTNTITSKPKEDSDDNQNNHYHHTTTASANAGSLLYQSKDCDEHNIGLVGVNMGTCVLDSRSTSRDRRSSSSFGKNNNNTDFDLNSKRANSITGTSTSSDSSTGSSKLIHSTFRIEQDVIKSLEKLAARRDISLSAVVNKILKNYITYEMYFEELGFLLVSKNFLRRTFEVLDQKYIEVLGKEYGLTVAREYVSYFYPQVNTDTLIQFLEIWFKRFQSFQHRVDKDNYKLHYFTINHDINMNFSLVIQSTLEGLIEPIIKSTIEFTNVTPSATTFSFKV